MKPLIVHVKKKRKGKKHVDSGAWTLRQIPKDRNLKAKKNKYPTYAYQHEFMQNTFWNTLQNKAYLTIICGTLQRLRHVNCNSMRTNKRFWDCCASFLSFIQDNYVATNTIPIHVHHRHPKLR